MIYMVFNAHGASCMAEGDSEAEAIENARPMFASNVVYDGPGRPAIPNPLFAQVGMQAVLLGERSIPVADDQLDRYEAAARGLRANLHAMIDAEMPQSSHLKTAVTAMADQYADAVERPSPFREMRRAEPSPGCYEASWGWVHSRPSCRCTR